MKFKQITRSVALTGTMLSFMTIMPLNIVSASDVNYKFEADDYTTSSLKRADIQQGEGLVTSLHSVDLRVIDKDCPGVKDPISDPINGRRITVREEFVRLRLTPEQTSNCYASSELSLGQSTYLNQPSLDAAEARNDIRVFKPGKTLTVVQRYSQNYQDHTALGNAGAIAQGWQINHFPDGKGGTINAPAYVATGFTYLPTFTLFGHTVPAGLYVATADLSTGYFNILPVLNVDISDFHTYSVKWEVGNIFTYSIDGKVVYTVNATKMRPAGSPGLYAAVVTWVDTNDLKQGLTVAGTGSVFPTTQYTDIKSIKVGQI